MPYVTGKLDNGWAVVDVLVGVSRPRRRLLRKHGFAVPESVHVRALIDTGASVSGFAPRVFRELGLTPVTVSPVLTSSTAPSDPHLCNFFDVSLALVAEGRHHHLTDSRVMEADCWHADEGMEALIGMDILTLCFFQLHGRDRTFTLAF
jgi:hypothetical protein